MFSEEDEALIKELGFDQVSDEQQAVSLQRFYETVQKRVGMALEDRLTEEQLAEFAKVSDKGDDKATEAWVRQAIPDYDKVIADETEAVKNDIKQTAARFKAIGDEQQ
jgi:hypothetical protein